MELTWITFPTIVVTVSLVAYYAAYMLKGNDLLVNKVDVVDIDQAAGLHARQYLDQPFQPAEPRLHDPGHSLAPGSRRATGAPLPIRRASRSGRRPEPKS